MYFVDVISPLFPYRLFAVGYLVLQLAVSRSPGALVTATTEFAFVLIFQPAP